MLLNFVTLILCSLNQVPAKYVTRLVQQEPNTYKQIQYKLCYLYEMQSETSIFEKGFDVLFGKNCFDFAKFGSVFPSTVGEVY